MKKITLTLAVFLILGTVIFGGTALAADDYDITIRLSHVFHPDEDLSIVIENVTERIKEKTDGDVNIIVFPNNQIASYKDGVEQVTRGANFISAEDPTYIGDYVPDFTALVGPMLYDSYDEYLAMTKTELVQDLKKEAEEEHNIKILSLDYIFGFRNLITDQVIRTPEDLEGVKLRVPGSQLFIDTLNAMGANSTPLPWGETISALQQGVVDGIEGTEFTNLADGIYEIKKNVATTRHFLGTLGIYISADLWDEMPAEYRTIVQEEFDKGSLELVNRLKNSHAEVVSELEANGVKFNSVDREAFVEATEHIYDEFPGFSPDIYQRLQSELEIIREDLENK